MIGTTPQYTVVGCCTSLTDDHPRSTLNHVDYKSRFRFEASVVQRSNASTEPRRPTTNAPSAPVGVRPRCLSAFLHGPFLPGSWLVPATCQGWSVVVWLSLPLSPGAFSHV